ncbi:MAG: NAD-dependent epimerase/dehydratase family protein [Saprospiraceae bacterium]|nr:NAD-dependent epimerase/dehydratase family protein [Saprospiraceae bacterium]
MKKIFVTGGTGFLGSYLLRYLIHKGYTDIRALKRSTSSMALLKDIAHRIQWIEGDDFRCNFPPRRYARCSTSISLCRHSIL